MSIHEEIKAANQRNLVMRRQQLRDEAIAFVAALRESQNAYFRSGGLFRVVGLETSTIVWSLRDFDEFSMSANGITEGGLFVETKRRERLFGKNGWQPYRVVNIDELSEGDCLYLINRLKELAPK